MLVVSEVVWYWILENGGDCGELERKCSDQGYDQV